MILTAALAATYEETEYSLLTSSMEVPIRIREAYIADVRGRLGLEAGPRGWLRLYAGLAGGYSGQNRIDRETSTSGTTRTSRMETEDLKALSASVGWSF